MMVGMDGEGVITGVKVTSMRDTPGVGTYGRIPTSHSTRMTELTSADNIKRRNLLLCIYLRRPFPDRLSTLVWLLP